MEAWQSNARMTEDGEALIFGEPTLVKIALARPGDP